MAAESRPIFSPVSRVHTRSQSKQAAGAKGAGSRASGGHMAHSPPSSGTDESTTRQRIDIVCTLTHSHHSGSHHCTQAFTIVIAHCEGYQWRCRRCLKAATHRPREFPPGLIMFTQKSPVTSAHPMRWLSNKKFREWRLIRFRELAALLMC